MKSIPCLIVILMISFGAMAEERDYGSSEDLGFGFVKRDYTVENPPGHWEALAHYSATFFKGRELGMLDGFDISPSGKYAIYTKSREGRLYMFTITNEIELIIKFDEYCYPNNPTWIESTNKLVVGCFGEGNTNFQILIDLTSQLTARLSAPDA